MLHLEVISNLADQLNNKNVTASFMEAVEIRQRLFRQNRANACILDSYDMFSNHLLVRRRSDRRIVTYLRVTSASECRKHDLPYPIENLRNVCQGFSKPYEKYMTEAGEPLHMGYMCMAPDLRNELEGIKLIELYAYLGFRCSGYSRDQVAMSATLNTKYNQDPWLKEVGPWLEGISDFQHPVIPEVHRVVMIPKLRENYWRDQDLKFGEFYTSLRWDGLELAEAA